MAVIKTTDYLDTTSHLKLIDEVFTEEMSKRLNKMVILKIFDEETNKHKNDTEYVEEGMSWVQYIPENAEYPDANPGESGSMVFTKFKYGAKIVITEEMVLYNEYVSLEKRVRSLTQNMLNTIEQCLADVLRRGFSSASYVDAFGRTTPAVGHEWRALFNSTDGNIITVNGTANPELSIKALDAVWIMGQNHVDSVGNHKAINYDTILVSPTLRSKADTLINSDQLPGSSDNAINPIKGKFKVVDSAWLGGIMDVSGTPTNTDKYWYVFDSEMVKEQLKVKWARHPSLVQAGQDAYNANWVRRLSAIFARGFLNFAYIAGSTGANAVAKDGIAVEVVNTTSNPVPTQEIA